MRTRENGLVSSGASLDKVDLGKPRSADYQQALDSARRSIPSNMKPTGGCPQLIDAGYGASAGMAPPAAPPDNEPSTGEELGGEFLFERDE